MSNRGERSDPADSAGEVSIEFELKRAGMEGESV